MIKITVKQDEEIAWITKHFVKNGVIPTQEDKEHYIAVSVHGQGSGSAFGGMASRGGRDNPLLEAKRLLDMQIKMWREDLGKGTFLLSEFDEDGLMDGYGDKIFRSIMMNLPSSENNSEGSFRTSSILQAMDRWGIDIKPDPDRALDDYRTIKRIHDQIKATA